MCTWVEWSDFFFSWRWGGSSTQAWMPTYVSILRIPQMIWVWRATVEWYLYWRENRRTRRKTCPTATLSTINPAWIDPVANPGPRGERPVTNDLSHGTALSLTYLYNVKCDSIPAKSCNLIVFPVNIVLQIVKIDSRHEFPGVWWLRFFHCRDLCLCVGDTPLPVLWLRTLLIFLNCVSTSSIPFGHVLRVIDYKVLVWTENSIGY
jgi:hypothetical protein